MNFLKRLILRALKAFGYVLLKETDFQRLCGVSPSAPLTAPSAVALQGNLDDTSGLMDKQFQEIYQRTGLQSSVPNMQAYAVYSAVRHLTATHISGDIVDCGEGSPETITLIAASLAAVGDTTRNLVLFDITADPNHRGETDLPLWGESENLLEENPGRRLPRAREPLPQKLAECGYPPEKISVVRFPAGSVDFTRPVAFLTVVPETYLANRSAIGELFPRLVSGGIIAAHGDRTINSRHALDDVLSNERCNIPLWNVTKSFRIGIKH